MSWRSDKPIQRFSPPDLAFEFEPCLSDTGDSGSSDKVDSSWNKSLAEGTAFFTLRKRVILDVFRILRRLLWYINDRDCSYLRWDSAPRSLFLWWRHVVMVLVDTISSVTRRRWIWCWNVAVLVRMWTRASILQGARINNREYDKTQSHCGVFAWFHCLQHSRWTSLSLWIEKDETMSVKYRK